jgi:glutamine amidotransferase
MRVHIVDHGAGNIRSVAAALERAGAEPVIARTARDVSSAERIVLPGVGAAGQAIDTMRERGLDAALDETVRRRGIPLLGICVGMQVMAECLYEHGQHRGLGWVRGEVRALADLGTVGARIPHTGWNDVLPADGREEWFGRPGRERLFYFNHGFAMTMPDPVTAASVEYGGTALTAALLFDSVLAVQFHPEKSQLNGQALVERFLNWRP